MIRHMQYRVNAQKIDPQFLSQLGEAFTSIRPPLSTESLIEIAKIRDNRLEPLHGENKRLAEDFFDAAETTPPRTGGYIEKLCRSLLKPNFSFESFVQEVKETKPTGQTPLAETEANERGFRSIKMPCSFRNPSADEQPAEQPPLNNDFFVNLTINEVALRRDSTNCAVKLIMSLISIEDIQLRQALIEDFGRIVCLRRHFTIREPNE